MTRLPFRRLSAGTLTALLLTCGPAMTGCTQQDPSRISIAPSFSYVREGLSLAPATRPAPAKPTAMTLRIARHQVRDQTP